MTADEYLAKVFGAVRIPPGTEPRQCTGENCGMMIYDVGNKVVSIGTYHFKRANPLGESVTGIAPTATEHGAGLDHHADCPDRSSFTERKKKAAIDAALTTQEETK